MSNAEATSSEDVLQGTDDELAHITIDGSRDPAAAAGGTDVDQSTATQNGVAQNDVVAVSVSQFDYADESWNVVSTVPVESNCSTVTDTGAHTNSIAFFCFTHAQSTVSQNPATLTLSDQPHCLRKFDL